MSDYALRTLLRAISDVRPDTVVSADSWREAADAAELNTAERGAAPRVAARLGYLEPLVIERDGRRFLACEPSNREHGNSQGVFRYMCGIIRNWLADLDERTARIIASEVSADGA